MLHEEDDYEDTLWTSNKCSTHKTEKSTITPVDNNRNKGCPCKKDIPLHTWKLQVDRMPEQHKIVQTNHLGNFPATNISLFPTKKKEEVQYDVSDSGATGHFLVQGAPVVNKKLTSSPLKITPPNGKMIQSTHTCSLYIPWLPNTVTEAHIVPGPSH